MLPQVMTDELLQSDIDLARRLIADRSSDSEIVQSLALRRISPVRAQRLVRQLREGVDVQPDPASLPQQFSRVVVRREPETESRTEPAFRSRRPSKPGGSHRDVARSVFGFKGLLITGSAVVTVLVLLTLFHNGPKGAQARTPTDSTSPETASSPAGKSVGLMIELQRDGLRVAGTPINRTNAFDVLLALLGQPSRTNRVEGSDTQIYTYDRHGLLLYAGDTGRSDSVVLYFEEVGGASGAETPFSGKFQIAGNPIAGSTGSSSLRSLPRLDVTEKVTNAIFAGNCDGFNLNFAYLKSPEHLSLVQIDLK